MKRLNEQKKQKEKKQQEQEQGKLKKKKKKEDDSDGTCRVGSTFLAARFASCVAQQGAFSIQGLFPTWPERRARGE